MTRLSKLQKWILKEALLTIGVHAHEARRFFGKEFPERYATNPLNAWEVDKIDKSKVFKRLDKASEWNWETKQREDKENLYIKPEYITNNSVEATISRSFKNLVSKGLIYRLSNFGKYYQKGSTISPRIGDVMKNFGGKAVFLPDNYGKYFLTEEGFQSVKDIPIHPTNINVKHIETGDKNHNVNELVTHDQDNNVKKTRVGEPILNFNDYQAKVNLIIEETLARFTPRPKPSPEKEQKIFQLSMIKRQFDMQFKPQPIIEVCCDDCKQKIRDLAVSLGVNEIEKLAKEIGDMS